MTMADVRPLAPTGAPGVGEPPISVLAIARATDRAAEGEEVAAARKAFPTLTDDEARAAVELAREDPGTLAPRDASSMVTLALPIAVGAYVIASALGTTLAGVLAAMCASFLARADSRSPTDAPTPLGTIVWIAALGVAGTILGGSLLRLRPWARWVAVAIGAVGFLVQSIQLLRGRDPLVTGLYVSIGAVLLAIPPVSPWFRPEGRAAAETFPVRAYGGAVAWGSVLCLLFIFVVPAFKKMFAETGVQLPAGTEILIAIAGIVEAYLAPFFPALAAVVAFPLLLAPPKRHATVTHVVNLAGLVAIGATIGWLALPVLQLLQKL
jgi:hypothetical protein